MSGANKGASKAGANPPVCTILCFSFRDTFLSATFLNFCLYLVNLALSLGFNFTFPLRMFSAHSDRHWRRSLSALRKMVLQTLGWAFAKTKRRGTCRFNRDVIPMCTFQRLYTQWIPNLDVTSYISSTYTSWLSPGKMWLLSRIPSGVACFKSIKR